MVAIVLERPGTGLLAGYEAALRTGWSPSNVRDLSGEHLAAIAADAAGFLAGYDGMPRSTGSASDGRARLLRQTFWISDGSFCGFLSFRYQSGTLELPEHMTGHVGYGVVPWKRGRGVATAALRALLPVARTVGLDRVLVTIRPGNEASRRVILKAGGVAAGVVSYDVAGDQEVFWVPTGSSACHVVP